MTDRETKIEQAERIENAINPLLNKFVEEEGIAATTLGPILLQKACHCAVAAGIQPVDFLRLCFTKYAQTSAILNGKAKVEGECGYAEIEIAQELADALELDKDPAWQEVVKEPEDVN